MKNIKQIFTSISIISLLTYILFNSSNLITKIIVIPFIVFSLTFFLKNIFLILNKKNLAKTMEIIYVIVFFMYYLVFLIYWDYISIINKDYMSLLLSLLAWFGGLFVVYRRYLRYKK